jgi:hypothetical protein
VTGINLFTAEITAKRLGLLHDLGQRFLGSNPIRRPRRVCRTMCG